MTILLMEGFDLYPGTDAPMGLAANWQISMSYASITIATGRFGGRCLKTVWAGATDFSLIYRALSAPTASFSFGMAVQMSAFTASPLAARSDRRLPVLPAHRQPRQSDRLPRLGPQCPDRSGPDGGPGSARQHMALYRGRRRDRRSGAVRVYVDGAKVLDLAGVDTQQQANAQIGIIQLGYVNSSATYLFDDLYVIDSPARLGERKITVLTPTADVAKPSPRRPAPTTTPASTNPCPTPPTM
jgi:hypothetical protein